MNSTLSIIVPIFITTLLFSRCDGIDESSQGTSLLHSGKSLTTVLHERNLRPGVPIFIRIFKEESELEMWVRGSNGTFEHLISWPICKWSGTLGPKLQEGDRQSPEGFYYVTPSRMNPNSNYHLAFDVGYPNEYDRSHGRTGSEIMVHGICGSLGCFAMTNPLMDEIWLMATGALEEGQPFFRVHIFPFRMTDENMERHGNSKWKEFWENLREGYEYFEERRRPPEVSVNEGNYIFE